MRLKYQTARQTLQARGIRLSKTADGEYRVNYIGKSERYAYYTDDLGDAYATGLFMAEGTAEQLALLKADIRIGKVDA